MCVKYCDKIKMCIKATLFEKQTGYTPTVWRKRKGYIDFEPRSRFCAECHKPIARASTIDTQFKGMLVQHLKWKHPKIYRIYKKGERDYQDLFYIKDLEEALTL
jgi:hypothetical protein